MFHYLVVKVDGSLWATGQSNYNQLGDDSGDKKSFGKVVDRDVRGVAAGPRYSMLIKTDGSLWGAGRNEWGEIGAGAVVGAGVEASGQQLAK